MNGKNIWTVFHQKHSWSLGKKPEYLSAIHLLAMTFLKKLVTLTFQVAETVYDNIGRPAVQTKTAEFFNSPLNFRPDFVDNMNWILGDMTGGVAN